MLDAIGVMAMAPLPCQHPQHTEEEMLLLANGKREEGGANISKRACLEETATLLDAARAFYVAFFLFHAEKVIEHVPYFSTHHQAMRERLLSADKLLTWTEFQTVETAEHPHPLPAWNFSRAFPNFPFVYRRSVIKDTIGRVRSYLSNLANWQTSGKKQGKPGLPRTSNHPTLYEGAWSLELEGLDLRKTFVRLKVYNGKGWIWVHYPVKYSRYFEQRRSEPGCEQQSPKLILRQRSAELYLSQTKEIKAKTVMESKRDPNLVKSQVYVSYSQPATPGENPVNEAFFSRFKAEWGELLAEAKSFEDLYQLVSQAIVYDHTQRYHTSIGCQTPAQFTQKYFDHLTLENS